LRIVRLVGRKTTVQRIEEVKFAALLPVADARGRREVKNRRAVGAKPCAFKTRREKASAPILWAANRLRAIGHNNERGQVLIAGTQAVSAPRAKGRPSGKNVAGIHLADRTHVIETIRPTGANHAKVIRMLRGV